MLPRLHPGDFAASEQVYRRPVGILELGTILQCRRRIKPLAVDGDAIAIEEWTSPHPGGIAA